MVSFAGLPGEVFCFFFYKWKNAVEESESVAFSGILSAQHRAYKWKLGEL